MEIKRLTSSEFEDFLKFHAIAYPSRKEVKERFNFQFLNNPDLVDKSSTFIYFASDKGKIVGQYGVNPCTYQLNGEMAKGFCGCDLFVFENYRKYGVGGFLSMKAINSCKPHFSIGISADAKPLLQSLNMKKMGEANIFLWFRNPWCLSKEIIYTLSQRNKAMTKIIKANFLKENLDKINTSEKLYFPESITVPCSSNSNSSNNTFNFSLLKSVKEWNYWSNYGLNYGSNRDSNYQNIFEFSRHTEFINWRFFSLPGYYLYQLSAEDKSAEYKIIQDKTMPKNITPPSDSSYFVVKAINWRGLNLLALVDYRCSNLNKEVFNAHLNAVKLLARNNKCDGIITLSSLNFFDSILKKKAFLKVGVPFEFYTNLNFNFSEEKIMKRETTNVTMVDSDLEFAFWPKDEEGVVQSGVVENQ